jgi:hypothetical protein
MTLYALWIVIANLCAIWGTVTAAQTSGGHIAACVAAAAVGVLLAIGSWFLFMFLDYKLVRPFVDKVGLLKWPASLLMMIMSLHCVLWGILSFQAGFYVMSLMTFSFGTDGHNGTITHRV